MLLRARGEEKGAGTAMAGGRVKEAVVRVEMVRQQTRKPTRGRGLVVSMWRLWWQAKMVKEGQAPKSISVTTTSMPRLTRRKARRGSATRATQRLLMLWHRRRKTRRTTNASLCKFAATRRRFALGSRVELFLWKRECLCSAHVVTKLNLWSLAVHQRRHLRKPV